MTKFSDLKLDPKVLKAIAEAGYESPTPIQAGAIPPALEGRDVLGIAQTGTGKTASFTLPMITRLARGRARARMPRSLVLCPTRELAAQVAENFDIYAKHTRLTKALLIGGVSFVEQDKLIDRGVDVLIATPGRLLDHFERGKLLLTGVEVMVVDEADRMLDMGFIPDIERIFQLTPFTRQTLFFSATMAPEIERITNTFLHAPERIEVARQATTSETITQKLVEITPTRRDQTAKQKRELLRALINAEGEALKNAIIFCNRKTEVDIVAKSLKTHGFDAAPIHGDLDQKQRMATLDAFRDGSLRFLIASDVAARGLDIPAVSHVFNFDLPSHAEDYVHRIGRTGRAGRQGKAISIATPADEKYLSAIENLVKQTLPRGDLPEGFSFSTAAQSAPRASTSRPASSRGRGRNAREDHKPEPRTEAPQPAAEQKSAPERRDDQSVERRNNDRRDDRRDNDRRDRRDERSRDERSRGGQVMGMGDHVPDFMNQSFAASLAQTAAADEARARAEADREKAALERAEAQAAQVADPQAEQGEAPAQEPAEQPKPARKRRSRRKTDETALAEDTPVEPSQAEPVAEPAPETAAEAATETQAEVPKPKRRSRAKKPVEPAEADVAGEADAQPVAKPRRSRKKAVEAEATDSPAGTDAATDRPAIPDAEGDAAEPPAEKPKRRSPRRKKPETESTADTARSEVQPADAPAPSAGD